MHIPLNEGGRIDIQNERIIIPIYFHNELDFESMKRAFNECLGELENHEKEILKEFN